MDNYTPEPIKLLRLASCFHLRNGKGDHLIWFSPINARPLVVDNNIKSRHIANAVLKQAGLPKSF
jgi:hypothetical protein